MVGSGGSGSSCGVSLEVKGGTMNKTKIEWALNPDGTPGYTWNPITGCLNGCDYCYARKLANTRLRNVYQANENVAPVFSEEREIYTIANKMIGLDPFYPRLWPEKLDQPFSLKKPMGIFTCNMSDLFGIGIPEKWTQSVMNVVNFAYKHRFYLLTKQPQNLIKFSPFPDNAWVGQTITGNEGMLSKSESIMFSKLESMWKVKARLRFISLEPLLDLPNMITLKSFLNGGSIKWVIIGAQSKPTVMPKIEWVREIVEAADKAGIPVFLKNNLADVLSHQDRWAFSQDQDIPQMLKLRQEFPKEAQHETTE